MSGTILRDATLESDGYCRIAGAVPPDLIARAKQAFDTRYLSNEAGYQAHITAGKHPPVRHVGDGRYMITVGLSGAFAVPDLAVNLQIVAIVRTALGPDAILESFGAVLAFPGAGPQHIHRDGPILFSESEGRDLPAYALTVAIPLVDMTADNGATELWPGSHRLPAPTAAEADEVRDTIPWRRADAAAGDALIWDFRLFHRGGGNATKTPRPILYMTYARPWFTDRNNWQEKSGLWTGSTFLDGLDHESAALFRHVRRRDDAQFTGP
ncbi:MAG: phytanoyl-CoA dioxygenase family protein [Pseudomonadota bacterium]